MVVDDVEDDFDARLVEVLDHLLELDDLLARVAGRAVAGHRREVAERVVAPVVAESAIDEVAFVDEVVDGKQLDGGDAELFEVRDAGFGGKSGVGPAEVLGNSGIEHREAADMDLVDDRVSEGNLGRTVAVPVEVRIDDDAFGDAAGGVLLVAGKVVAGFEDDRGKWGLSSRRCR